MSEQIFAPPEDKEYEGMGLEKQRVSQYIGMAVVAVIVLVIIVGCVLIFTNPTVRGPSRGQILDRLALQCGPQGVRSAQPDADPVTVVCINGRVYHKDF